jgi:twinkle protein
MNALPNLDFAAYFRQVMGGKPHMAIADGICFGVEMHRVWNEGEKGIPLMWNGGEKFRIRRKEVTVVSGINGHGKSNWMGQVLLDLASKGEVCCNLSMEMPPARTLIRQCRQAVGAKDVTEDYKNRFLHWTRDRMFLSDFDRPLEPIIVLGAIAWAVNERRCTQIVVDSLMKCGIAQDDYNGQKAFVNSLCEFAKALDVHIWLVAHGRKKGDELAPMDKFDVAGHADITNLPDNVITVFRNKRKERAVAAGKTEINGKPVADMADALARCDKQRHGEWEGTIPMNFNQNSGQFTNMNGKAMDILISKLDAAGEWKP